VANDADYWRQWMRRYGRALLLFARQWSSCQTDAEDAVQGGFVRFWQTRERARDQASYLYSCVRSAAMDIGRGERRRGNRERDSARGERSDFQLPMEKAERAARIEMALGQLPADQREVVVMKIWGELTFAQIGEILGVPLNTSASRYRLALARLVVDLAEELAHE
jgi:RNA polymerase sigma factor (sigma-70 family)